MLQICKFYSKIIVLVCSVYCHLNFTLLVIKFLMIVLRMKLYPRWGQMIGLNLIKMWHWIMQYRKEHHDENSHINYWRNKMDIIPCFKYLHIWPWFSWNIILAGRTIVLQLLLSEFFDSNFPSTLPLTKDNLDYCWINDNFKKVMDGLK